jgi:hypothetical protein
VVGTGEADVLNQIVPILSHASGEIELPLSRGLHLHQRYWLENVRDSVGAGQFYFDA